MIPEEPVDESVITPALPRDPIDTIVYVLQCVLGMYYVGRTKRDHLERFAEHRAGTGSSWTSIYPPLCVICHYPGDKWEEDKLVLQYMEKYGVDHVRGGSYSAMKLSNADLTEIRKRLDSANDRCYKCHMKGHFANKCGGDIKVSPPVSPRGRYVPPPLPSSPRSAALTCERCWRRGHIISNCSAYTRVNGSTITPCTRCGRYTHERDACLEKTDIAGRSITPIAK